MEGVKVSIIVPTRNSERTIKACLASARRQGYANVELVVVDNYVELVVVDNASSDATVQVATAMSDIVAIAGPERSAQRNLGAQLSSGQLLLFLDSDMALTPEVVADAVAAFCNNTSLGCAVIPEYSFGLGFWAHCRALEKRLYLGDPAAEAARVFRRVAFETAGGFNEGLLAGEDYELADRVAASGWESGRLQSCVWHNEGRVYIRNSFLKKRYYGSGIEAYFRRRRDGQGRSMVRRGIVGNRHELVQHPLLAFGLVILKLTDAAGLLFGLLETRFKARAASLLNRSMR